MRWKIFVALLFSENRRINAASLTNSMVRTLETGHCRVEHIPGSDTEQSGQDSWAPLCAGSSPAGSVSHGISVAPNVHVQSTVTCQRSIELKHQTPCRITTWRDMSRSIPF
ncbi:hypothetical protein F5880DRAFT_759774 [Lentinula raphanica]|nr:hypothetical protein F5880DRAFT_759774 [Lentinula raphanica]